MNKLKKSKRRVRKLLKMKYISKDWKVKSRYYTLFRIKMFLRGKK